MKLFKLKLEVESVKLEVIEVGGGCWKWWLLLLKLTVVAVEVGGSCWNWQLLLLELVVVAIEVGSSCWQCC